MGMDSHQPVNVAAEIPWLEIQPDEVSRHPDAAATSQRIRLWALTLDSRSIPCQIDSQTGWRLLVPPEQYAAAVYELRRFEELNRNWPRPDPPHHPLTENALAAEILAGQWWRVFTALTLHADWAHLSSNLAIGGIFIVFLCRELGSGLAWSLLLGAGALGNLVNAFVQPANHSSVGASTAVFGAVGILAAISLVRYRRNLRIRWMLPVAAALALLALLGTEGKNTDLGAHLFGFVYGGCLGLITEYLIGRNGRPGWLLNALLALSSFAVVVAAWWAAVLNK